MTKGRTVCHVHILRYKEAAAAAAESALLAMPRPVAAKAPVAGPEGQKYGGTLKVGTTDFGHMDPALMGVSSGSGMYSNVAYDNATLTWYDGTIKPDLLESWTISDDVTKYTFKVREGVRFHDGKLLTADDIAFTFNRLLDEATASPARDQLAFIKNVTAPDDFTVVFELVGANAFLPQVMAIYHARILPNINLDEIESKEFGSVPYILEEHNPAERTVLRRNTDYWKAAVPFIDEIVMFYMPEQTTRVEALKSGAIDMMNDPPFSALEALEASPNVHLPETARASVRVIVMNTKEGIFTNKNLRKALQVAFDRSFVREATLFGRGSNANDHPVGLNDAYYWKDQPIMDQDISLAKQLLAEAGYPDGIDLTLHTADINQMLDMSLAFKESVTAAGIRLEVVDADPTTFWDEVWMKHPLTTSYWGALPANEALSVELRSGGDWTESFYNNPRIDELLDLANAEGDFGKRKAYFQEIQEILIEDVPTIYAMYLPEIVPHRSRIKGVIPHPRGEFFWEHWWIVD
jgi:peptide/nickel transport system substrate-binding protein